MANLADLAIGLTADNSGVVTAFDEAAGAADNVESTSSRVSDAVDQHWQKIAAGAAAGAAALEGFARSQAPLVESGSKLAASIGSSTGEIRDLALEAANVTFPLEDVYASMEAGRQQGLKSGEQLQEFASFWDTVGDATGESGPELAKASTALRAVGIAAGEESDALGALGFVTEETTSSTGEFLRFLDKTGPDLRTMGADVNDAAAVMGILEREMGMSGRTARTEFKAAIAESDGTLAGMLDTLGITEDQFADYSAQVEGSTDIIGRNAAIHAESYTALQKAQHWAGELAHKYSGLTSAASTVAGGLASVVPALTGVMTAKRLSAIATAQSTSAELAAGATQKASMLSTAATKVGAVGTMIAAGASYVAAQALNAAQHVAAWVVMGVQSMIHAAKVAASWLVAMGPVGWVTAAVVGLVVLIVANWEKVWAFTKQIFTWVGDKIASAWRWITETTSAAVRAIVDWFVNLKDRAVGIVTGLKDRAIALVVGLVTGWLDLHRKLAEGAVAAVVWLKDKAVAVVVGLKDRAIALVVGLKDGAVDLFTSLRDGAVGKATALRDQVLGTVSSMKDRALGFVTGLKDQAVEKFAAFKDGAIEKGRQLLDWVTGLPGTIGGAVGDLGGLLVDKGQDVVRGLWDGIASMGQWIASKVTAFVSRVIPGPIKKALGISSPSTVAANLAREVPRGLVVGMEAELGRLQAASERVAFAALPSLVGPQVPRLAPAALARAGRDDPRQALPDTLTLRVGDREFTAYVDERAGRTVDQRDRRALAGARAG